MMKRTRQEIEDAKPLATPEEKKMLEKIQEELNRHIQ